MPTAGTDGPAVSAGMNFNLYSWLLSVFDPMDASIHKRFEFLDPIQDSLELHPGSFSLSDVCSHFHHLRVEGQDAPFLPESVNSYFWRAIPLRFYPQIILKTRKNGR
jgi:hypothetical protein